MPRRYDRSLEDRPLSLEDRVGSLTKDVDRLRHWKLLLEDENEPTKKALEKDWSLKRPAPSAVDYHLQIMAGKMQVHGITFNQMGVDEEGFENLVKEVKRLAKQRIERRRRQEVEYLAANPVP